jgi:prevent-host-death family protein
MRTRVGATRSLCPLFAYAQKAMLPARACFSSLYDYNDHIGHMPKSYRRWAVAQAKAKFSAIIDRALTEGPQTITRSGRKAVVVVSVKDWERKESRKGNLAEFFAASPLRGSKICIKRSKSKPRKIAL